MEKVSNLTIVYPADAELGYRIAGDIFAELWRTCTAGQIPIIACGESSAKGDLVVIGSDAVNPEALKFLRKVNSQRYRIRYGTDDYHIWSVHDQERNLLILAGGCVRATIYAVYDFFRIKAGAEYFWDGDRLPFCPGLSIEGCDYAESPRFKYRGQRYFAHRGLHRFQAEHWDFDDWKREIDWLLKKRMNMFMLRIGIDDLFQRAFPEICPYPPEDGPDPDRTARSYDDRSHSVIEANFAMRS